MSRILPQPASVFYSPFLLLGVPKIAGLLPAHAVSLHRNNPPPADTLTCTNPKLENLPPYIRTEMQRLLATLLDGAVEMLTGGPVDEYDFVRLTQRFGGNIWRLYDDTVLVHTGPYREPDRRGVPFRTLDQMDADAKTYMAELKANTDKMWERSRARVAAILAGEDDDEDDSQ